MGELKDPLVIVKAIEKIIGNLNPTNKPDWTTADTEKLATTIYQKLKEDGYLKNPDE